MSGGRQQSNASARQVALLLHLARMVCQITGRVRWCDLVGEDRADGARVAALLRIAAETARDGLEADCVV